jgi:hypothetical protein
MFDSAIFSHQVFFGICSLGLHLNYQPAGGQAGSFPVPVVYW